MALTKHKDGDAIRNIGNGDITLNLDDKSNWSFKSWDRSELLETNNNKKEKIILIFLKVIIGLNLKKI